MNTTDFKRIYAESRNGVDQFYFHPFARSFAYSDGVKDLADTGCHWLLDILATELPEQFEKHKDVSNRCCLRVHVADGKDPNGRQTKFAFTGGGESLRVLADAIHNAIQRPDGRAR